MPGGPGRESTVVNVGFSGGHDSVVMHRSGLRGDLVGKAPTDWMVITPLEALGGWPPSDPGNPGSTGENPPTWSSGANPFAPRDPANGAGAAGVGTPVAPPVEESVGIPDGLIEELLGPR